MRDGLPFVEDFPLLPGAGGRRRLDDLKTALHVRQVHAFQEWTARAGLSLAEIMRRIVGAMGE